MPARKEDLPSTLERSPKKVQETYEKTLDNAHEEYHDEARAPRTAWASVKHVAEKKGDHWEPKEEYGPSDEQAERGGRFAREGRGETAGGVNANKTKDELLRDAREADIPGRSKMSKDELVEALARSNDREKRHARARGANRRGGAPGRGGGGWRRPPRGGGAEPLPAEAGRGDVDGRQPVRVHE